MKKPVAARAGRRTGQAWAAIVARYGESGLSPRAFAESEGISVERLRRWLAKLRVAEGGQAAARASDPSSAPPESGNPLPPTPAADTTLAAPGGNRLTRTHAVGEAPRALRIAFLASEVVPFVKTGGLADVVGALSKALSARGHELIVILPKYAAIDSARWQLQRFLSPLGVWMGTEEQWWGLVAHLCRK